MTEDYNSGSNITSEDKVWSMLAYILSPIVPIIILLMKNKRNRPFIKAHNAQALAFGVIICLLTAIFGYGFFGRFIGLAGFVVEVIWGLQANRGEYVTIPYITDFCKKQNWS
ncbi:MAG: DUF4870 domain-containing protein [Anaerolineaceae bacterium]